MKKRIKMSKLIVSYIFIALWMIFGCTSVVKTNVIQSSFDVNQSKENGVFVDEYIPLRKVFVLGDEEINIQEAWVEHYWEYKNQKKEIKKKDGTEGYIKIETEATDLFDVRFISNNKKNGISGNKLTFEPMPNIDTLTLSFYNDTDTVEILLIKK